MFDIMTRDAAGLDIALLKAFRSLVQESSVTHAAQALGIGQPAMSAHLKRLRQIFGDPILTRSGAGSKPTLRAVELAASVNDILSRVALLEAASDTASSPRDFELTVTIAATDYARQMILDRALPRIREEAPGLRLRFQRSDRDRVREWMEQGSVDMGVGAASIPTGRLRSRRLYRDAVCCVAGRGVMPPNLTLDAYCALPHVQVITARHSEIEVMIEAKLRLLGRQRHAVLTVPDFAGVVDIVLSVPVLAALPRGLANRVHASAGLDVRPPPFALPDIPITLYWHDRTDRSAAHKWLRDVIVKAFRTFAP
ncbi:MAG TPA: LysR family transcriptional regulator [Burkholderiaceae bacterium]|nr:LysR family transcriptional regulator [Burkholderiaceae bacterium]